MACTKGATLPNAVSTELDIVFVNFWRTFHTLWSGVYHSQVKRWGPGAPRGLASFFQWQPFEQLTPGSIHHVSLCISFQLKLLYVFILFRSDSSTAARRLAADLRELQRAEAEGVSASPVSDSNIFLWNATIVGPDETAWEGANISRQLLWYILRF
jgi:hypothetical protein